MKAIRVNAPGGPEVLHYEDVADPTPKAGEATVKVDAAGINYIDVYQRSGQYKLALPLTLGLEAGGTVTAVGSMCPRSRSATKSPTRECPARTLNTRLSRPRASSSCRRGSAPGRARL